MQFHPRIERALLDPCIGLARVLGTRRENEEADRSRPYLSERKTHNTVVHLFRYFVYRTEKRYGTLLGHQSHDELLPVSLIISHVEFHDILFAATDERRLQPAERRPAADLQRLPERHELPELVPKRHSVEVALHPVAGIQPSFDQPVDDRRIVGVEAFVGLGRRVSREVVEREGQFDPAPFAHLRPRQTLFVIDIGDITVGRIAESRVIRRVVVERLGGILLREQRRLLL